MYFFTFFPGSCQAERVKIISTKPAHLLRRSYKKNMFDEGTPVVCRHIFLPYMFATIACIFQIK